MKYACEVSDAGCEARGGPRLGDCSDSSLGVEVMGSFQGGCLLLEDPSRSCFLWWGGEVYRPFACVLRSSFVGMVFYNWVWLGLEWVSPRGLV